MISTSFLSRVSAQLRQAGAGVVVGVAVTADDIGETVAEDVYADVHEAGDKVRELVFIGSRRGHGNDPFGPHLVALGPEYRDWDGLAVCPAYGGCGFAGDVVYDEVGRWPDPDPKTLITVRACIVITDHPPTADRVVCCGVLPRTPSK